jgi:hypothetical protein
MPLSTHNIIPSLQRLCTRTIPNLWKSIVRQPHVKELSSLIRRQSILPIPATYSGLNSQQQPGTVAGIVIGSVAGFLLILWLIYTCLGQNGQGGEVIQTETIRRRSRSPRRRSVSRSETIEITNPPRRERTPPRREPIRRETVVVEEMRMPVEREDEDDIVEVIEEHSPTPPPRRARSQRASGYRNVDPDAYGGGDRPMRKVRR